MEYNKLSINVTEEKIWNAIDNCEGDLYKLADNTGLSIRTIHSYFALPKNIKMKERFAEERWKHGTHPELKAIKERSQILSLLEKFNGSLWFISLELNICYEKIKKLVRTDTALRKLWEEERNKFHQEKLNKKLQKEEQNDKNHKEFDPELTSVNWEALETKFLPHQLEFASLSPEEVKHPALVGGFGSGKTMAIPLRWLKLIDYRMEQGKPCELMILEPTKEMIRDIIVPTLDEFFESLGIKTHYVSSHNNYSIIYRGKKHKAMLRSADRPRSLTGRNLTDFIIDEFDKLPYEKQKITWRECIARIRRAEFGTGAIVTTPEGFKLTYELWGKSS